MTTETHANADPQELAKFSDLAHRWWDPNSEFRPLHEINPLRLDWIDSRRAHRRQARPRRRLRRRHPRRGDGAPRRDGERHRPRRQAAQGGAAASPRKRRGGRLRAHRRRTARAARARRLRRRHLHGDAGARARPREHRGGVRRTREARRPRVLLDHQPQSRRRISSRSSARSTCCGCCPRARTITRSSSNPRSSRAMRANAGLEVRDIIGMTYNPSRRSTASAATPT